MDENKPRKRHIIVKFQNTWTKKIFRKFEREREREEKKEEEGEREEIHITLDISLAILEARRQWRNGFK